MRGTRWQWLNLRLEWKMVVLESKITFLAARAVHLVGFKACHFTCRILIEHTTQVASGVR